MNEILVVEDEQKISAFLEKGLRKYGFAPTVVSDGEQAIQAAQAKAYAVILLDLALPLKDGWTVLQELRAEGNQCPVIVVTAFGDVCREVLAAGANDYVPKPFQFKDLLAAVRKQVARGN